MAEILVVGASRGIGLELVRQYRVAGRPVLATARDAAGHARLAALGAATLMLDVTAEDAGDVLEHALGDAPLKVAILNAGVYGPRTKGLDTPRREDFDAVMHVNVHAAMRIAPRLLGALERGRGRLAVISSRMGAIGPRGSSAGWLYRASKAALNSVLKDVALAAAPRGIVCAAFHPGWVRTDMGGAGADIDVETSARGLRARIDALGAAENGGFYAYDGTAIPW